MFLNRLICRKCLDRRTYRTVTRTASSVTGESGRVYVPEKVLQRQRGARLSLMKAKYVPDGNTTIACLNPISSRSQNECFVLKAVTKPFFELSQTLAAEFAGSSRLRMHIDCNERQDILVYPYFRDTLLGLIQNDPDFPPTERKKILQHVGEAIQELHARHWIHLGAPFTICRSDRSLTCNCRREA